MIDTQLTSISQEMLDTIVKNSFTAKDALGFLNDGMILRPFSEVLALFSGENNEKELKGKLVDALCGYEPSAVRDSVRRKVSNWFKDTQPEERETLIQLCFAMKLSEKKANAFLSVCGDGGFHMRDSRELSFAYCMRVGRDYPEAVEFISRLEPPPEESDFTEAYTDKIISAFAGIDSDADFMREYAKHREKLGALHNTAYYHFSRYLQTLIQPAAPMYTEQDEKLSVASVVEEYLQMKTPLGKNRTNYSVLQRAMRRYWPDDTTITEMRLRNRDVTRKTLILLYAATEGFTDPDEPDEFDEDELTPVQQFTEHYNRLNTILHSCGFSPLDPRNPFDWAMLYSMKPIRADSVVGISDRLEKLLGKIFS